MRCLAAAGVEKVRTIREEVMKSGGGGGVSLPCVSCHAAVQMVSASVEKLKRDKTF